MRKWLLRAAVGVGLLTPLALLAQTVVQSTISGNEIFRTQNGVGGTGGFIAINTVRNSTNIVAKSGSGAATSIGTGGTLVWVSTAPTTWAITLPTAPANGTIQLVTSDTTLTSLVTVTAGTGDTMTTTFTSQTITANSTIVGWQYLASTKIWYRIQ